MPHLSPAPPKPGARSAGTLRHPIAACVVLGLLAAPASAAESPCTIRQLTHTTGSFNVEARIDVAGGRIAFRSTADLVPGGNADGNEEIFLLDVASGAFRQITNTLAARNLFPSLSYDGTRIAFESDADLVPGGNPRLDPEIFLYDTTTSSFTQVTPNPFSTPTLPHLSGDGQQIVFTSPQDFVPGSNPDGSFELFRYDVASASFTQVTNTLLFGFSSLGLGINGDGNRIAFVSDLDHVPGGNPDGSFEIFLADVPSRSFIQITDTGGFGLRSPPITSVDASGTRLTFFSRLDLVPGSNPDSSDEIFFYDTTSGNLTQITSLPRGRAVFPVISADGSRLAFSSGFDVVTGGGIAPGLFLYDFATAAFHRITHRIFLGELAINGNGTRFAFPASEDLVPGSNTDGNVEIFFAECAFSLTIEIDIKPGSDPNALNPRSGGLVPVAILTTSTADGESQDFDAWDVDPTTVAFGPAGATIAHASAHAEDVDGDGDLDMVLHFRVRETGIACGDPSATLTGETFGGQAVQGSDSLETSGCR